MTSIHTLNPSNLYSIYKFSDHRIIQRPSYNICLIGKNGNAVIQNVYKGQVEFLAGKLEDELCQVIVSSDMEWEYEKMIKTICVDGKKYDLHENRDTFCSGAILFDVTIPSLPDPVKIQEGMDDYHQLKEAILKDSFTFTVVGIAALVISGHIDLSIYFGLGGGLNQIYQLMLYKEIDVIGTKNIGTNFISRLLVLIGLVISTFQFIPPPPNNILSYILSCLLGFSTGKLALMYSASQEP